MLCLEGAPRIVYSVCRRVCPQSRDAVCATRQDVLVVGESAIPLMVPEPV